MKGGETSAMRIGDTLRGERIQSVHWVTRGAARAPARTAAPASGLRPVHAVVDLGEEVVARLHVTEPSLVYLLCLQLVVQLAEAEQVLAGAADGVVHHRS